MHSSETDPGRDDTILEHELVDDEVLELEPADDGQELVSPSETGSDDRLDQTVKDRLIEAEKAADSDSTAP